MLGRLPTLSAGNLAVHSRLRDRGSEDDSQRCTAFDVADQGTRHDSYDDGCQSHDRRPPANVRRKKLRALLALLQSSGGNLRTALHTDGQIHHRARDASESSDGNGRSGSQPAEIRGQEQRYAKDQDGTDLLPVELGGHPRILRTWTSDPAVAPTPSDT